MRRFSPSRTQSWSTAVSSDFDMESVPHTTKKTKPRVRNYDTGFPEPFCGSGNTTLRHPDADTSPNACIYSREMDDKEFRSRRSFLVKHKRTTNYGKIRNSPSLFNMSAASEAQLSRPSTEGSDTTSSRSSSSAHSDAPFPTIVISEDGETLAPTTTRSSMFRKLRRDS